jgi:hypothetical protein
VSDTGWGIIFVLGLALMASAVLSLILWQGIKTGRETQKNQITTEQGDAYRKLAERATEAQETAARQLTTMREDISDLRARVAAMERMMREVE